MHRINICTSSTGKPSGQLIEIRFPALGVSHQTVPREHLPTFTENVKIKQPCHEHRGGMGGWATQLHPQRIFRIPQASPRLSKLIKLAPDLLCSALCIYCFSFKPFSMPPRPANGNTVKPYNSAAATIWRFGTSSMFTAAKLRDACLKRAQEN